VEVEGWDVAPNELAAVAAEAGEAVEPSEVARVDVEKVVEKVLFKRGLKRVRVVCFVLPTEYGFASVEHDKLPKSEGGYVVERRVFKCDVYKFQYARRRFYDRLRRVAYRTPLGWILFRGADPSVLDGPIGELNALAGERRVVWIFECWLPRDKLECWLAEYLVEVKARMGELEQKVEDALREAKNVKNLKYRLRVLEGILERIEEELKYL